MTYPSGPGSARVVYYNYPTSGVGGALSRLDNIAADGDGTTKYAQYTYLGASTMVKVAHPAVTNGLNLTHGTGRPTGDETFIDKLQRLTGRILRPKPPGRPRKKPKAKWKCGHRPHISDISQTGPGLQSQSRAGY